MYELKYQRAPSDDPLSSRQKVAADYRFQDGRFARGLGSNHDDLREVDCISAYGVECILELVDDGNEVTVHGHCVGL